MNGNNENDPEPNPLIRDRPFINFHQNQTGAEQPTEIRIEIHSSNMPEINFSPNISDTMQNNISSLLTHARTQIERHRDPRTWGINITNVFQQARTINNIRNWMPHAHVRYLPLVNGNEINTHRRSVDEPTTMNNPTENVSDFQSTTNPTEGETIHAIRRPHNNDSPPSPDRPILNRVAALTRDDPPDLLAGPSLRHNRRQGNNNGTEEEGAFAELFSQDPEARRVLGVLGWYIPFACILLFKTIYDHFTMWSDLSVLAHLFIYSNFAVREQAAKQIQRQKAVLARYLLFISLLITYRLAAKDLSTFQAMLLVYPPQQPLSLSQLLCSVVITDLLLKLFTIAIKMIVIMLPPNLIKYKERGRIFVLVEGISQFYRSLVPIHPWLIFLLDSYTGYEKIFGFMFSFAYMVFKGFDVAAHAKFCKKSLVGFMRKVNYGKQPTKEQLQTTGTLCPICHDSFDTPVMLECTHVFCEFCIGTWFSREQTCPLCRAKMAVDYSWQDGSTTFLPQLY